MVTRARLDAELVRRGLARSRGQAAELIEQGRVVVRGVPAGKPATVVDRDTPVTVRATTEREWASRGAHKLIGALDGLGVDPAGMRCLDAGASTGGFTDVLLERGAAHVVAVDVGYGQMVWRLQSDERVEVHDRTNVRTLTPEAIGGAVALTVADLSFISLRTVLPALAALHRGRGCPVADGEAAVRGRDASGWAAGGVVREAGLRLGTRFSRWPPRRTRLGLGHAPRGRRWHAVRCPGPSGNVEFFLWPAPRRADERRRTTC